MRLSPLQPAGASPACDEKKKVSGVREGLVRAMDERGGAKSQTGREISCQPQRHRQEEEGRGSESDGPGERGWRGGVRIVRGAAVETVKEGGSKAPGFSRDLCEIPAMPRVKKKTALRPVCQPLLASSSPRPSPRRATPASLRVVVWKWKWPGRIVPPLENLPLSEAFSERR